MTGASAFALLNRRALAAEPRLLRIGQVLPASGVSPELRQAAARGALLGAEEGARTAELLGAKLELLVRTADGPQAAAREALGLVEKDGVLAVVGGLDAPSRAAIAEALERHGVLFLTTRAPDDLTENEPLRRNVFHVASSPRHRREALARESAAQGSRAVDWHSGLTRFGAEQLNGRFRERFGAPMDSLAWASWMAVTAAVQLALRNPGVDRSDLPGRMEAFGFDGHKGERLRFRREDHQLEQPLYLKEPSPPTPLPEGEGRPHPAHPDFPLSPWEGGARGVRARLGIAVLLSLLSLPTHAAPFAYVSNERSGTVTILDVATDKPVANLRVHGRPRGIQVSADGKTIYVARSDPQNRKQNPLDAVLAIDVRQRQVVAKYDGGSDPEQFAVSPDGKRLFISNEDAGTASVTQVEKDKGKVIATLIVGIEPEGVAISPDGRWVYVTAETSNTVSVIDTKKNEVAASFLVDPRPRAAAFSPDGRRAYVTAEIGGTVSVVDVATHQVVSTIDLGPRAKPVGVVVSPDGKRVYVANGHGNSVAVIDAAKDKVVATIPVGKRPWGVALTRDGRKLYTANGVSNDVSVIDTATNKVMATVKVGDGPWGVAISP
ncbi:MAG TPA: PQQ-dependent catabolism-associated beta-propeller protein [Thermoanaerobaculia bacterium]